LVETILVSNHKTKAEFGTLMEIIARWIKGKIEKSPLIIKASKIKNKGQYWQVIHKNNDQKKTLKAKITKTFISKPI
jgi:hypothetical protein